VREPSQGLLDRTEAAFVPEVSVSKGGSECGKAPVGPVEDFRLSGDRIAHPRPVREALADAAGS